MLERVMKMDKKMEEQIRQIVREEIAAHEERPTQLITAEGVLTDVLICSQK